jgi:amino acid adenylation domain-containing protein
MPEPQGTQLSPQQRHLWRAHAALGGQQHAACAVRIDGPLDPAALATALSSVAARHPLLRTRYALLAGTSIPVQSVPPAEDLALPGIDRTSVAEAERGSAVREELERLTAAPFDLAEGTGLRVALVQLSADCHALLLAVPALSADAASCWEIVDAAAQEMTGAVVRDVPFGEIEHWQADLLAGEDAAAGLAFWREVLLAPRPEPRVSLERARATGPTGEIAEASRDVPAALADAVRGLARERDAARSAVYLAAWHALLARHTESDELCLGVASHGRLYEGLEHAIGPLQKVLPVSLTLAPEASFAQHLARADAAIAAAFDRHEFFDQGRLGQSELAAPALGFEYVATPEPITAGALTFTLAASRTLGERARLALVIEGGRATLRYDAEAFSLAAAQALLDQYTALLAHGCRAPDTAATALELNDKEQRERLLRDFARVPGATPSEPPLHETIARAARARPEALAVVADHERLTHGELEDGANRLAGFLRAQGVGPGAIVGIYMHGGAHMALAILGVLKAGGAYLPLPPAYPDERVAFMLADSGAKVVLTVRQLAGSMPDSSARAIVLDDELDALRAQPAVPPPHGAGPDDPAYVIYTSGSTGKPKGVRILHQNLAHSIGARFLYYQKPVESYLLLSSFAFDSSIPGIFWTWASGGTLVFPTRDFGQDLVGLPRIIALHRVSHLLALPSLWSVILKQAQPGQLASLTTVVIAGESATREVLDLHRKTVPGVELHNEYGPTEGTVWSTVFDCSTPFDRPTVPIGRPIPGARAYIVDARAEPCAVGVPGELWIGGAGVAEGYHGRPELTAERFRQNPFDAGRIYRTGDVARFLPDGLIEFLGRRDHQVKIRGYRIELEEIENALVALDEVREAAVIAREDSPGELRVVGYVTAAQGAAQGGPALRARLQQAMPEWMVPAAIVVLEDLPRLPNGKVDRKALPSPDLARSDDAGFVAPRTPLERVVAHIWGEVLKLPRVSIQDDFFDLGGHSLLATQLFARLLEHLDVEVPLRAIFEHRTVADLCAFMLADEAQRAKVEAAAEELAQDLE